MTIFSLIFGLVFGGLINYFSLGFCGAVACIANKKNTLTMRTFLLSVLISGIGIFIFKLNSESLYHMIGVMGIDIPFMIGAFIFGIGMILCDGCLLGMVRDLGRGFVYHIATLIFFILGTLLGNLTYRDFWLNFKLHSRYIYLPGTFGNIGGLLIFLVILISLYAGLFIWCRDDENEKENRLPKKNICGAVIIGILLVVYEVVIKNNLGISGAFPYFGAWTAGLFGAHPESWSFFAVESSQETLKNGPLADPVTLLTLGILIGSFLVSLIIRRDFKLHKIKSKKQVALAGAGGLLMGYGVCIAGSCSLAGFMTSAANLSLSGWVYFLFMFLGGSLAIRLMKLSS